MEMHKMDIEAANDEGLEPLTRHKNLPKIKIPMSPSAGSLTALTEMFLKQERNSFKSRLTPNLSFLNLAAANSAAKGPAAPCSAGTSSLRPSGDSSPSTRSPSPSPHINVVGPSCKWRRSDRRFRRLNTELLEAVELGNLKRVQKCLDDGARPNAACRKDCITACHVAALMGHEMILLELLHKGADPYKPDACGRTPLHLAAWAGKVECLAFLLDVPEDIFMNSNESCNRDNITENILEYFKRVEEFGNGVTQQIDARCAKTDLKPLVPKNCRDSFEHECLELRKLFPDIPDGFMAIHAACATAQFDCLRVLMAAGAKLDAKDMFGRTPLDTVGFALTDNEFESNADNFLSVIRILLEVRAPYNTMKSVNVLEIGWKTHDKLTNTPLHQAVELECLPAIYQLLEAGVYPGCFNSKGQTPLHSAIFRKLTEPLKILANIWVNDEITFMPYMDLKNSDGFTPLQVAVKEMWIPGVCILLEAGANVAITSDDGETALHFAAEAGNLELLDEILSVVKKGELINSVNKLGETPLFKAVINNHLTCVRTLILEGALITMKLPNDITMIHKAAECGNLDILKELLKIDSETNKPMINETDRHVKFGLTALHLASLNNHPECVKILLDNGADIRARTTSVPYFQATALHIAVTEGHAKVTEILLQFDRFTTEDVDLHGWLPIHAACHHGKRECIALLINAGADLSATTYDPRRVKRTAVDMLIHNVSRPKDFLEQIFDSFIYLNGLCFTDSNCEVKVDYSVLMPQKDSIEQMKVIVSLLNTGNRFDQKKLLLHPLIESFLYLKWKALSLFFYGILFFYGLFVIALTTLVFSTYYLKDTHSKPPSDIFISIWKYILFTSISFILMQELFYMKQSFKKYLSKLETWVKLGSFAASIAFTVIDHRVEYEWPRHITTVAVLLAWIEMMFLLSRFPSGGYYVLMFAKVALNVIKVLLTFLFLLIGFSIAFMLQFHSLPPFDNPWAALVKTLVMMASEFDYLSLFDDEHVDSMATPILVGRIMFVVFLVLASIVLMNLMVGLAVSDITDLEIQGKIQRLAKQVEFLGTLDSFVYNESIIRYLPRKLRNKIYDGRNVNTALTIYPGRPRWRHHKFLPTALKDGIFQKASQQKLRADETIAVNLLSSQVSDIHSAIVKRQKMDTDKELNKIPKDEYVSRPRKQELRHQEIIEMINEVKEEVADVKDKISINMTESNFPILDLDRKVEKMQNQINLLLAMMTTVLEKTGTKLDGAEEFETADD